MMRKLLFTAAVSSAMVAALPAHAGKVLDGVKQRGVVICGVHTGRAGFAIADSAGNWKGLDVDFCRAVAAAVLGDANKVKFVPTSGATRITALQSGEIDVLARNTTWTHARDASLGLVWAGINFYDGQGFIARRAPGRDSAKKLNGATICLLSGSTTELNLSEYFRAHRMTYKPVVFDNPEPATQAFESGRCQAYTGDYSAIAVMRATELKKPDDFVILPEVISKEPLGPAVKRGDDEWFTIVKWVLNAMIEAEDLGISQANVDAMRASSNDPAVKRFVGTGEDTGKLMGLDKDWTYRIVKQVGNYAESFDSNLGSTSRIRVPRGYNKLWKEGGLMYSPPLR